MSDTGMSDAEEMPSPTRDFDLPIDLNKLRSALSFLVNDEEQSDTSSNSSGIPLPHNEMAGNSVPSFGDRSCSLLPPIGQDVPTPNLEAPDTLRLDPIRFEQTSASPVQEQQAALAVARSVAEECRTPMDTNQEQGQGALMADSSRFDQRHPSPVIPTQEQQATLATAPSVAPTPMDTYQGRVQDAPVAGSSHCGQKRTFRVEPGTKTGNGTPPKKQVTRCGTAALTVPRLPVVAAQKPRPLLLSEIFQPTPHRIHLWSLFCDRSNNQVKERVVNGATFHDKTTRLDSVDGNRGDNCTFCGQEQPPSSMLVNLVFWWTGNS